MKKGVYSLCIKTKAKTACPIIEIRRICYGLCLNDGYLRLGGRRTGRIQIILFQVNTDLHALHAGILVPLPDSVMPGCRAEPHLPIQPHGLERAEIGRDHGMSFLEINWVIIQRRLGSTGIRGTGKFHRTRRTCDGIKRNSTKLQAITVRKCPFRPLHEPSFGQYTLTSIASLIHLRLIISAAQVSLFH